MRVLPGLLLVFALWASSVEGVAAIPLEKAEPPKLTGKWTVTSLKLANEEIIGRRVSFFGPNENGNLHTGGELIVTDKEMTLQLNWIDRNGEPGSDARAWLYELMPGTPAIDIINNNKDEAKQRSLAIYSVEGDVLKIIMHNKVRPADFEPKEATTTLVCKRLKR